MNRMEAIQKYFCGVDDVMAKQYHARLEVVAIKYWERLHWCYCYDDGRLVRSAKTQRVRWLLVEKSGSKG